MKRSRRELSIDMVIGLSFKINKLRSLPVSPSSKTAIGPRITGIIFYCVNCTLHSKQNKS